MKRASALIVGGSLTGLAAGIALARAGVAVTILEQTLDFDRGGTGLGVDRALLAEVTGADPRTDDEQPHLPVIVTTRETSTWHAIRAWLLALADRIDGLTVREGVHVRDVAQDAESAAALTDGETFHADVLIGADGYRSTVRRAIDPQHPHAIYGGFVIWRSLVAEAAAAGREGHFLGGRSPHPEVARLVAYYVPGANGSTKTGARQITFAWYDAAHTDWLNAHGVLENNEVLHSIDASSIDAGFRAELRAAAQRTWSGVALSAVTHALDSGSLFGTPLAEYYPQRLVLGRLALLGDAAHVASPMVGHGLAQGWIDAHALAAAVTRAGGANPQALARYEQARLRHAQSHVAGSMAATSELLASVTHR